MLHSRNIRLTENRGCRGMTSGPSGRSSGLPRTRLRRRSPLRGVSTFVAIALVAALGCSAFSVRSAQGAGSDAVIAGQVLAGDTGAPLEGVAVYRYELGDDPDLVRAVATTDTRGRYTFSVGTGTHVIVFNPGAWSLPSFEDGPAYLYSADSREVTVGVGDTVTVDATLVAVNRASISGTVTDADTGAPVAGAIVSAWSVFGGSAITAGDGTFTIEYLPSASYVVFVDGSGVGYGTTYWNLDEWEQPGELDVGFNEAVSGIDTQLTRETVTYTARYYDARKCTLIGAVATALGISESAVVRRGVEAFRALAESNRQHDTWAAATGTAPVVLGTPAGAPLCAFDVTWDASEAPAIESTAAFFGGTADQLHEGGGRLVVLLIMQTALQG